MRLAEGLPLLSSAFRVCCALLCPGAAREFCFWDPWRQEQSRGKESNVCLWAALSFVGLGENGGGSSTLPDLPDFSPTLFPVRCSKYQMMRKISASLPSPPSSEAVRFRRVLAVSQSRAVSPATHERTSSAL